MQQPNGMAETIRNENRMPSSRVQQRHLSNAKTASNSRSRAEVNRNGQDGSQ